MLKPNVKMSYLMQNHILIHIDSELLNDNNNKNVCQNSRINFCYYFETDGMFFIV